MTENWYEVNETVKLRNDAILNEALFIRLKKAAHRENELHGNLSTYVLGNLGKAFSSLGDTLQNHYHFGSEDKDTRKVS